MSKKSLVIILIIILVVIAGAAFIIMRNNMAVNEYTSKAPVETNDSKPLFVPELIDMTEDGATFEITADETEFEFFEGQPSQVKSYNNQGYLGKTIKLKEGNTFYPTVTNNLEEPTSVHWHGLEVTGENDGTMGPKALVNPGESKTYELAVDQQAATIWYHPHIKGYTASQAYEGLAGMIIIEDENTNKLNLPDDYGVNDFPVVLQAKLFNEDGTMSYGEQKTSRGHMNNNDVLNGYLVFEDTSKSNEATTEGFTIMTNGSYQPFVEVENDVIRLRTLNGSNSSIMDITTSDDTKLNLIATDGGLLEKPQSKDIYEIAAGQRFEVLVDLSDKSVGDTVDIIANNQVVLTLKVTKNAKQQTKIPTTLNTIEPFEEYVGQQTTDKFILTMHNTISDGSNMHDGIDDKTFKKDEINYFEVTNRDNKGHSFHIHNAQFLVVEINGKEVDYAEIGFKDTIYLDAKDTMKLQVKFKHTGDFMYHCHILIHEEGGMIGMFSVEE